jgi:signal transduction histidine kinase
MQQKDKILQDFYLQSATRNRIACYLAALIFISWGAVDYLVGEPLAGFYLVVRFVFSSILALVSSPFNDFHFNKHSHKYLAVAVFTLSLTIMGMYLTSENKLFYMIGYSLLFVSCTPFFLAELKYYIPSLTIPFVATIIFWNDMKKVQSVPIELWTAYMSTIVVVCGVAQHYFFKAMLKNSQLKIQLNNKHNELQNYLEEKNQLVRILCHDLGNTITIVEMSNDIISQQLKKNHIENKHLTASHGRIRRAMDTQKEIVEHVKNREALESGKKTLEIVPTSILSIFEKVKFNFQNQLKEKNISLNFIFSTDSNPYVMAESVSLSNNVISNIISNAIKFSPDNSTISVSSWVDKERLIMTIEDEGIGIPQEMIRDLFKSNIKTTRPGLKGERGTGFGMPLVKSYMEQYGGNIFIESKENKGTRVILQFIYVIPVGHTAKAS